MDLLVQDIIKLYPLSRARLLAGKSGLMRTVASANIQEVPNVERWLRRTRLQAEYTRRAHPIGESAHLQEMLQACGDADVVVLAPDAQPLPGWLAQLAACLARGVGLEAMTNAAAARTFNVLASEGRRVVAGFVIG